MQEDIERVKQAYLNARRNLIGLRMSLVAFNRNELGDQQHVEIANQIRDIQNRLDDIRNLADDFSRKFDT